MNPFNHNRPVSNYACTSPGGSQWSDSSSGKCCWPARPADMSSATADAASLTWRNPSLIWTKAKAGWCDASIFFPLSLLSTACHRPDRIFFLCLAVDEAEEFRHYTTLGSDLIISTEDMYLHSFPGSLLWGPQSSAALYKLWTLRNTLPTVWSIFNRRVLCNCIGDVCTFSHNPALHWNVNNMESFLYPTRRLFLSSILRFLHLSIWRRCQAFFLILFFYRFVITVKKSAFFLVWQCSSDHTHHSGS